MKLQHNGHEYDVPPENWAVLHYPNMMMDGLFIDMGEDYCFVSAHQPGADDFIATAIAGGAEEYELTEAPDLTAPPHCWVVASLARLVVRSFEEIIQ